MRAAVLSLNAAAFIGLALPVGLIWRSLAADGGQAWIGLAFLLLIFAGVLALGLAGVILCRPRSGGASRLILAGATAFVLAFAILLFAG